MREDKPDILILGHLDCRNKGNEAVLLGILEGINTKFKKANIHIITEDRKYDKRFLKHKYNKLNLFLLPAAERYRVIIVKKIINGILKFCKIKKGIAMRTNKEMLLKYRKIGREYNSIIVSAKDLFTECYGQHTFNKYMEQLEYALDSNQNVSLLGGSFDPISEDNEKRLKQALKRTKLVSCRESESFEYIKNLCGEEVDVRKIPDPAFYLISSKPKSYLVPKKSKERIGFSISEGIISYKKLDKDEFLKKLEDIIITIKRDFNFECIFIPHVQEPYKGNDDYGICKEIANRCKKKNFSIIMPPPDLKASEYKYLIGTCDYFVGFRTHATIASLSQNIPTITVAYSRKAYGIFKDMYGSTDYVINIKDFNENNMIQLLRNLLLEKEDIQKQLFRVNEEIKKQTKLI